MKGKDTDNYPIEVSKEFRRLLLNALKRKGWYFFKNPNLVKCWVEMKCRNKDCPSYKSSNLRCWQVAGTFCKGNVQGAFAKKFGDCQKCNVYLKAVEGDLIFNIGEDFNNLMFQLKTKEDELMLTIQNSEEKNQELEKLNKKIKKLVETLDKKNTLLRELSIKDDLTGLYNYRFFRELMYEQFNLAKRFKFPLSCIMIDIDYFKAVNDTYGHQAGDMVLSTLADILRRNVREADKVVRYGGEEFVIILPYTDSEDAYIKAERLRQIVSDFTFNAGMKKLGITISLGTSTYQDSKKIINAERLVEYADKALYQAKLGGRNQTVTYSHGTADKENNRQINISGDVVERRKYPRIQTLIKITCGINDQVKYSGYTFDISYSGLCFVCSRPAEVNRRVSISLYLAEGKKTREIKGEGITVWCKGINDPVGVQNIKRRHQGSKYLIGLQFVKISKKDRGHLQKYFVSLFKKEI